MISATSPRFERSATKLLREYGEFSPPVDVESLARSLGMSVSFEELDNDVSGLMLIEDGVVKVAINEAHHRHRQRFTLAHEIGHMLLHAEGDRVFVDRRFFRNAWASSGELREEIEANAFAAALLMPEALVREHLDAERGITDIDVFRLATQFAVSEQAMTLRLVKLNVIEPD
ncbi:MAG: ImmA/IrrE family metallo-endopeptidase [Proteobacteria bacterium]|nr:ImmA/IrrE family metallo-endopeptidase [Pseudomonadota bacterium]